MDIAKIPIVDFLRYCKEGAREQGYSWIVCILCRAGDCRYLYESIERDWRSLDSITGKSMLVLLAGNEVSEEKLYSLDTDKLCITDKRISYIKRYNPFATIIGNSVSIKSDISSVRYSILKNHIPNVEKNQTDAINALRRYFGISEQDIPCLVYSPLYEDNLPIQNIVVPFPEGEIDLYAYFKRLFNRITPLVDELSVSEDKLQTRIENTYKQLVSHASKSTQCEKIMQCIQDKQYLACEQPTRALLSRYIDLCALYKQVNGIDYHVKESKKSELLSKIENAFYTIDIPLVKPHPSNVCISMGDNNRIKNSNIYLIVQTQDDR